MFIKHLQDCVCAGQEAENVYMKLNYFTKIFITFYILSCIIIKHFWELIADTAQIYSSGFYFR